MKTLAINGLCLQPAKTTTKKLFISKMFVQFSTFFKIILVKNTVFYIVSWQTSATTQGSIHSQFKNSSYFLTNKNIS